MKALSVFFPYVLPYVMGCPKATVRRALVDAAIEFCETTQLVQQTLDVADTEQGNVECALFPPRYQAVAMPLKVWFKGNLLSPAADAHVQAVQTYNAEPVGVEITTGDPREYFALGANKLGLYPVPESTEAGTITVRAALKPTRSATQLEDVLFEDWAEVIAAGALMRLHQTAGQPWSDAVQAVARERAFRVGMNRARIEASRGRTRGELRVTPRAF